MESRPQGYVLPRREPRPLEPPGLIDELRITGLEKKISTLFVAKDRPRAEPEATTEDVAEEVEVTPPAQPEAAVEVMAENSVNTELAWAADLAIANA